MPFTKPHSLALTALVVICSSTAADEPRFARDILPTLSENCFFCHGPDEENRSADLRLDTKEGMAAALDFNDLSQSEILNRVLSDDRDITMPPPDSNRSLSSKQKADLKSWVVNGAAWGRHWSFEKLQRPSVPEAQFDEYPVRNPIDAFVQRKLFENGLRPSVEADRATLLRRVYLDLTGLPPGVESVDAFMADTSPNAYEQVVEKLLASPAYGERMAWDWLDAARYADTNGYQGDRERTMWPWRDWVIDAFNNNMPFDEFTTLQLAGDLLPNATDEQILATGFCRNYMINGEGGRIPEENRVDYVMDMSETMGTVWLGLTLNCCRCHDHKYDPLTQAEYYQFYAFFNQTPVTGAGGDPQTAPNLTVYNKSQESQLEKLRAQLAGAERKLKQARKNAMIGFDDWKRATEQHAQASDWNLLTPVSLHARKQRLKVLPDNSILAEGSNAENDTYTVSYRLPPGPIASMQLDALQHETMTRNGLARSDSGNFVLTGIECSIQQQGTSIPARFAAAEATFEQGRMKIEKSFDGNPSTGWAVYDGRPLRRGHSAVFRLQEPINAKQGDVLKLTLRHESRFKFHNLGRFQLSVSSDPQAEFRHEHSSIAEILKKPENKRSEEELNLLVNDYLRLDSSYQRMIGNRQKLLTSMESLKKSAAKVMVMANQDQWRPTFILNRGLYNDVTDREVTTLTPGSLPPLKSSKQRPDRLDLANWLLSREQPMTARVTVNRFWSQYFGIGLVKTIEDFGVQAEYPEYKDLLDWMADDFRSNGWNVKRLVRQIVTSHTYRQSSILRDSLQRDEDGLTVTLAELDPANRLLARASRFRMPSWMLRDNALAVSGLLNRDVGGPSINTYQPAGVWEEATFGKKKYAQDTGAKLYRRSLYIFWRRIIAPTMFFDNASRQFCTVKSSRTNTPLHTLLTLNEITYVESARTLAQSLLSRSDLHSDEERLAYAWKAVLSRQPSPEESSILLRGLERSYQAFLKAPNAASQLLETGESARDQSIDAARHAAWTTVCLTLINADEALTRE